MTNFYRIENRRHDFAEVPETPEALEVFVDTHRRHIEPWLSAIFQSEHLGLLVGSGFSVGLAASVGAAGAGMAPTTFVPEFDVQISAAAARSATAMGRGQPNIEDQLRSALALHAGLEVLADPRAAALMTAIRRELIKFARVIVAMEAAILAAGDTDAARRQTLEDLLSSFLLSFASRTATRDRLHIFTTNYDRLLEYGFDLVGIRPIDRFVGALSPIFRASRFDVDIHYNPQGARLEARPLEGVVRYAKLHGSIDWFYEQGCVRRHASAFGETSASLKADTADSLMIYPNSAKDVETAYYPYADLFRDLTAFICRPNTSLVTYGYGFGDDHINRGIVDMLSLPSTHLVIISYDDPGGRIGRFIERTGRSAQISALVGTHFAKLDNLTSYYLPKPAIDTITTRRTEILDRRGDRRPPPEAVALAVPGDGA
jgi:hypothetical protein